MVTHCGKYCFSLTKDGLGIFEKIGYVLKNMAVSLSFILSTPENGYNNQRPFLTPEKGGSFSIQRYNF